MTRSTKSWLVALGVVLGYRRSGAQSSRCVLKLHGAPLWRSPIALAVAGILSAWLVFRFMRDRLRTPKPGHAGRRRRRDARRGAGAARRSRGKGATPKLGALPVLLVLGPEGSTKTTTIVRSGLEPELLAGDVFRGETVAPTAGVNVWFAQNTVDRRSGRAARRRRAGVAAARARAAAAQPRVGAHGQAAAAAARASSASAATSSTSRAAARPCRRRRARSARGSAKQPKAVRRSAADVRGVHQARCRSALRGIRAQPHGGRSARAARRAASSPTRAARARTPIASRRALDAAFDGAVHVARRATARRRWRASMARSGSRGAYEFPREFGKLQAARRRLPARDRAAERAGGEPGAARLLLRRRAGGVRHARRPRRRVRSPQRRRGGAVGDRGVLGPSAARSAPRRPPRAATRKVPRWDFLPRFLREVVFGDEAAVRLTAAGARVGFWRRVGLGDRASSRRSLLGIAFMISYSGNQQLESAATDATRGIAALPPNNVDLPPTDALTPARCACARRSTR